MTLADIAPHASAIDRFGSGSVDDADDFRSICLEAQHDRVAFRAFEATRRSMRGLLMTLAIPLLVLVLMPRVRPMRTLPLALPYLPPLLPLFIWWDGLASMLRTRSVAELRTLVEEIAEPHYAWEVHEVSVPKAPIAMPQVIGGPLGGKMHDHR